jgi:hypothetical protein
MSSHVFQWHAAGQRLRACTSRLKPTADYQMLLLESRQLKLGASGERLAAKLPFRLDRADELDGVELIVRLLAWASGRVLITTRPAAGQFGLEGRLAMPPIYAFRVVIASVGFIVFVQGILYLFDAVSFAIGLGQPLLHLTKYWYAVRGIFGIVLGFLIMGGVPQFLRLAFPDEMKEIESARGNGDDARGEESSISK